MNWLFCCLRLKSRLRQFLFASLLFDLPMCSKFSTEKLQLPTVQKPLLFKFLYIPLLITMHLYGFLRNSVIYGNDDLIQILIPQVFSICNGAKSNFIRWNRHTKNVYFDNKGGSFAHKDFLEGFSLVRMHNLTTSK